MTQKIFLYKKTHTVTGLNYLGKTTAGDPHKYTGSGKYWLNHIKKHGYFVETEILKECFSKDEVKQWGIHYSKLWNVVKSDEWANLMEEKGDGGTTSEIQNKPERLIKNKEGASRTWKDPKIRDKRIKGMIRGMNIPKVLRSKSESMKCTLQKKKLEDLGYIKRCQEQAKKMRLQAPMDKIFYTFRHKTGKIEKCLRSELIKKYNLHRGNMSSLVRGKIKSVSGWRLINKVEN